MCVYGLAYVGTGRGEGEREGRRREVGESCTVIQALTVHILLLAHVATSDHMCTNYV